MTARKVIPCAFAMNPAECIAWLVRSVHVALNHYRTYWKRT